MLAKVSLIPVELACLNSCLAENLIIHSDILVASDSTKIV